MAYVEIYKDVRYYYAGGKLAYIGKHTAHKAPTSDKDWVIWKAIWDGDDFVRLQGPIDGVLDDMASLNW